jgi:hypothetical protein
MYLCVMGIDFASFYHFSIGIWSCYDNVLFIIGFFILLPKFKNSPLKVLTESLSIHGLYI